MLQQVELATAILDKVPGPHFVFIDPRWHISATNLVKHTRNLVRLFKKNNIHRSRIVFNIPSSEAGINATRTLSEVDRLNINLTLVCGLTHASICAEAGAAYITFNLNLVSPILLTRYVLSDSS